MLYPKIVFRFSILPRFQATSIAWRIARSTLLGEVSKFRAIEGYSCLVMLLIISGFLMTSLIASFKNCYPLICAGMPMDRNMLVMRSSSDLLRTSAGCFWMSSLRRSKKSNSR